VACPEQGAGAQNDYRYRKQQNEPAAHVRRLLRSSIP
jgi:hypothetical protein